VKKAYSVIAIIGALTVAGYALSQWKSYHAFEGRCLECHLTVPQSGGSAGAFRKDISAMCADCHSSTQAVSHPVDVVPSMEVPAEFPLDWRGFLTCVTCHTVHGDGYGAYHMRSGAVGGDFCGLCHSDMQGTLHGKSVESAHVDTSADPEYISKLGISLDSMTLKCLACHRAVFAVGGTGGFGTRVVNTGLYHNASGSLGVSHPIGVRYSDIERKKPGDYHRGKDLPKEVQLFGGQIGCATCHDPYSKEHYKLVLESDDMKSTLCIACHMK
jgi:hypothetical protein